MARYMLTGVDDDLWRRFKAICDLQGCTMRQSFIDHINIIVAGREGLKWSRLLQENKPKKGGKKQ